MSELPLFPLHTVLFPGGRLSLRIFEARYVDLVGRCLRDGTGFGVCLIREGAEAGEAPTFVDIGTSARIVDWSQRADGLLGITVEGDRRFRVCRSAVRPDRLLLAEVEWLAEMPAGRPGSEYAWLAGLLADEMDGAAVDVAALDTVALGFRIAERMPLPPQARQRLLEIDSPEARLDRIAGMLKPRPAAGSGTA